MTLHVYRSGSTLITCTLVLLIVSVMAISLAATSGVNLQIANNQHRADCAFASAESGLEVSRYWLSRVRVRSDTPPANYLGAVIAAATVDLEDNGISNFRLSPTGTIPTVLLHPLPGYTFQGQWSSAPAQPEILRVATTGTSGLMSRTVIVEYRMRSYRFPIFNFGIATQGAMILEGITNFKAATASWEADTYIGSSSSWLAVDAARSASFAGDVVLGNPNADIDPSVDVEGEVSRLGANDELPEFPQPDIPHFRPYATGPVYGPGTDFSTITTITNAVIAAGTNPTFSSGGNIGIDGILYIEAPNQVTFVGHVSLRGMIVADGNVDNPGSNQINFGDPSDPSVPSSFNSGPYPSGAQFDAVRQEQGSCILAPGFRVSFGKNFQSSNGVIAASGLVFDKNITAKVGGTLINYSDEPLRIGQNANMTFDRSAMVEIPAGFDLYRVPVYDPGSYTLAY